MGEIHSRLDEVDSHLVARSRLELWIAEFVLDASRTALHELPMLIREWFADTQTSTSTTNIKTLEKSTE